MWWRILLQYALLLGICADATLHGAAVTNSFTQVFTLNRVTSQATLMTNMPARLFAGPAHWVIENLRASESFASTVAAGNFYGGRRRQLMIGVRGPLSEASNAGKIRAFSFSRAGELPRLESTQTGFLNSFRFGNVLSSGDATGDGISDLLVGMQTYVSNTRLQGEGLVALHVGSPNGLSEHPFWASTGEEPMRLGHNVLLADMNRDGYAEILVAALNSPQKTNRVGQVSIFYASSHGIISNSLWSAHGLSNEALGESMAVADVNGDDWPDLLLGAPGNVPGFKGTGRVLIFHGGPNGLPLQPTQILNGFSPELLFGNSLATMGDLNGDGCEEIVVGAPGRSRKPSASGEISLYWGSKTGLVSRAAWKATASREATRFGSSVARAGDVNGDGIPDLLSRSSGENNAMPNRVFLWLGKREGFSSEPDWQLIAAEGATRMGEPMGGAGDLDGDGLDDFYVASPASTSGKSASRAGRIDVFRGLRKGYAAGEIFPADGQVCVSGDVSAYNLHREQYEEFVNGMERSVSEARKQTLNTRMSSHRKLWVAGSLTVLMAIAALWLWRSRRRTGESARLRERERIARDLHDGLGSGVHRLQRLTELLNQVESGSPEAQRCRDELLQTAQELGGSMDRTIWAVQPENDTLENLVSYLAGYAPSVLRPYGIECELDLPAVLPPRRLHGDTRQQLFLAVNEALNNVVKHSRAKHAWLRVAWEEPWLEIVVEDDGCGFTPSTPRPGGGNGLKNLRERLATSGGDCTVRERSAGGVCVEMRWFLGTPVAR